MIEKAFEGTILAGKERRYTIINERDIAKYADQREASAMRTAINNVGYDVEQGRIKDGKNPFNTYLVINMDEPYADEVIAIMKQHGHLK